MIVVTGPWSSYASQASTVLITDQQPKQDKFHYIEIPMAVEVFSVNQQFVDNLRSNDKLNKKVSL